jgi:hypothetical protein
MIDVLDGANNIYLVSGRRLAICIGHLAVADSDRASLRTFYMKLAAKENEAISNF